MQQLACHPSQGFQFPPDATLRCAGAHLISIHAPNAASMVTMTIAVLMVAKLMSCPMLDPDVSLKHFSYFLIL